MTNKRIYRFEPGKAEGRAAWKELLGGKGANLAEMAGLGVPVPPGFTITTEMCVEYMRTGEVPAGLMDEVRESMAWLETATGKTFGHGENPLLVSVRSGARSSMPGMMDTVLDLGLNPETLDALARKSGSRRFAYDAYRRLLTMFGNVVLNVPHHHFEEALTAARLRYAERNGLTVTGDGEQLAHSIPDSVLTADELSELVDAYKGHIRKHTGEEFPNDPYEQLEASIVAVFKSWNNHRAEVYRKMHGIPEDWGTAVNVQAMVFGNLGETSATGVAFTRDPSTGERRFFGEWLPNAQGEDVVAGIRTPRPLARPDHPDGSSLEEGMHDSYRQFFEIQYQLESHFRDMQDIEFTIEDGTLFILQTRNGKRSARASVRIAVEMVDEGLLTPEEAIMRIESDRFQELLFPAIEPSAQVTPIATGLPASPGAVSGAIVFQADEAEELANLGKDVILVRTETSADDLHGMNAARGILTARGGATSHAAVVARGMGRTCVVGCSAMSVNEASGKVEIHGPDGSIATTLLRGAIITIDGSTGRVFEGSVPTIEATLGDDMQRLLSWCDNVRRMRVRTNADTPEQATTAIEHGADGIGLCRTEHMFFAEDRIGVMREMILARTESVRQFALARLLPFQTDDFVGIFRAMAGKPVTIRLLDPPLHEFLPQEPEQRELLAKSLGVKVEEVNRRVAELHEQNPMLGHRGVRLAVTYPEIAEMQVRAIFSAACTVQKEGIGVHPEVMIPLAFSGAELRIMRAIVDRVAAEVFKEQGVKVDFAFGTMIELPRAALLAGELAGEAEFFSFGTNDLTQTILGLSRDDSGTFLPAYIAQGILPSDPFVTLDRGGVGEIVRQAMEKGSASRPSIHFGICGEHGGDPASIQLCEELGVTYVSCSPFRVPIARLAAAQATLATREA